MDTFRKPDPHKRCTAASPFASALILAMILLKNPIAPHIGNSDAAIDEAMPAAIPEQISGDWKA